MIKAKEISVKNMVILLAFSFAVSAVYYLSRPHQISTRSIPVFMGEEVVVQKAVKAGTAIKAVTAVKVEKAPMPAPKATPLPIIPPSITYQLLPTYPSTVLERGLGGTVLLSVYVGLSGQPEKVETKTSSGVAELDRSASAAVSQWRFSPATQGGAALASWFEVPVRFEVK